VKAIFQRRLSQSYMIIERDLDSDPSYELEIFSYNKVPGLLPIQMETTDGMLRFWYEITGRQSLADFLRRRKVDMELIHTLFLELKKVCGVLQDYLLTEAGVLLEAEYIYLDFEQQHAEFVYLPGLDGDIRSYFRNLMEQILQNLNHNNKKAVNVAYEVYQRTLQEGFSLEEMLEEVYQTESNNPVMENVCAQAEEKIRKEVESKDKVKADHREEEHSGRLGEEQRPPKTGVLKNMLKNIWEGAFCLINRKIQRKSKQEISYAVYPEDVIQVSQETLHPTELLYSISKEKGILMYRGMDGLSDITIQKESFFIGKKESEVDGVIDRSCISRVHAKIELDGEEYYIEDMNSTNGTYLNGQQLEYHQRVRLKEGDNITFGTVEYRFV
jgi:hypothetical protein